jgi:hypothetical protein
MVVAGRRRIGTRAVQASLRSVRARSVSQRSSTGIGGRQRSLMVQRNRRSLARSSCSWDDAIGRFGLWSRRSGLVRRGSRRAATDRRRDPHDHWRTVADRRMGRGPTPAFTCGFLMILPVLYPSDVQAGIGSLDLTWKRSEVQSFSRPPHPDDQRKRWSSSHLRLCPEAA